MSDRLARRTGSALLWRTAQVLGGRGLSLVRLLVLARLLAPDAFGLVAVAMVALELALAVTQTGTADELIQRERIDRAHYDTAWTIGLLRGAAIAGLLAVAAPVIAELFNEPAAVPIIRVLALKPLVDALASVRLADLARDLQFRPLALVEVAAAVSELVVAVVVVAVQRDGGPLAGSAGAWAIVAGAFAGAAVRVGSSYAVAPHRPRAAFERQAGVALLRFGKWVLATQVIALIGTVTLRAVVSRRLGTAELGVFYLGLRIAAQPNEVVGDAIRAVAFPVVARVRADLERVARTFRAVVNSLFLVLAPVYAVLAVLAVSLADVLGPQWAGLAAVLVVLAADGVVDVPADATKPLVLGLGRPARQTALRAVRTAVIVTVAWPFTGWWGAAGAAGAYLAGEAAQSVAAALIAARSIPRPFAGIARRLAGVAVVAGAAAAAAAAIDALVPGAVGVTGAVVAAGAAAVVAVLVLDRRFGVGLSADLARAFPAAAGRLGLVPGGVE